MVRVLIYIMAFSSGFAVMAVEMMGGRILAPWFGGSIYIWGSIISIFLIALSLGYLLGGQLSMIKPSLRKYGWLFIGSGISMLPSIYLSDVIMNLTFIVTDDPRYGSFIAATLLFFLPALSLGMISPYSIRLLVKSQAASGHTAGRLYFISTLGSALGTIGTAFYFVRYFEINQILFTTIFCLLILGISCQLSSWNPDEETTS
ncbi:MAG: glycosyl transferase [Gammaproteobacteria bacterium]|nr:glycosyl transferase [Gammaproteobacteria bacterium]